MISKDLKKLNRRELVDIIYQMKKNEQQMQEEIATLQASLQDKRIKLSSVGSIAEAAADISQVFSAAQTAADLYLQEIACMKAETEKECERLIEDAKKEAKGILLSEQKKLATTIASYQIEHKKLQLLREELHRLEQQRKLKSFEV